MSPAESRTAESSPAGSTSGSPPGRAPAAAFVTFEGVDGAGKSTQLARLAEALREAGREVVVTREPGGSPGAEEIRRLLVEGEAHRWSPETEILLFTAARRDHVERVIQPALRRGAVVLCDRFADSTRAYQGAGDAARRALVDRLHETIIGIEPGLTLILDLDPADGLARASERAGAEDRFERKGAGFQQALRREFHRLAEANPGRCVLIDATGDPDTVAARILAVAEARGLL